MTTETPYRCTECGYCFTAPDTGTFSVFDESTRICPKCDGEAIWDQEREEESHV